MQRDDPAFALPAPHLAIERRPLLFAGGLFGWLHRPTPVPGTNLTPVPGTDQAPVSGLGQVSRVAVICPPIGPEYTRSHRTVRHLADRLARAGIAALRFDYEGTGDSFGDDAAPGRLEAWRNSVAAAVAEARAQTGCEAVCLIGIRLGATLAALEAAGVEQLVLWNPVVKGRAYARELQAMAMTAGAPQHPSDDDAIDSAGFRVSRQTLEVLKAIDLARHNFATGTRVLLVDRDDLSADTALPQALASSGIEHERLTAAGWNAMMADHQFTVVPEAALDGIVEWVRRQEIGARATAATATPTEKTAAAPNDARHPSRREDHAGPRSGVLESPEQFGADRHLFGILTRPAAPTSKAAVLLLNAGSIHHVGPHRLYVRLARELAARGHGVLRFDFEGIGDSVRRSPGHENHPYEITAIADLQAAVEHVSATTGARRVILIGLCSGAYHVFKAGLELEADIERLVAINPWYFEWREGLSLDTTVNHYESVAAYRSAARDPQRWKRLIRGEVDLGRLARVGWAHVAKTARGRWDDLREAVLPGGGTALSRGLRAIAARGRPLHLFQSDGEPAETILATEAGAATRRLARAKLLTIERIRGGDHTFSRSAPREQLVDRLVALLESPPA